MEFGFRALQGREYPIKAEGCSNRAGSPANERPVGLLGRLRVEAFSVVPIGTETNLLEQQEEGVLVIDPQAVYVDIGEWELPNRIENR